MVKKPKHRFTIGLLAICVWLMSAGSLSAQDRQRGYRPTDDIADRLAAIEGMTVTELPDAEEGYRAFMLNFDQPADHNHPTGERFEQRMLLMHLDTEAPMVFHTHGYSLWTFPFTTGFPYPMAANELRVEHRFFQDSRPASGDWSLLTIEQAAADHHRIVEAIRPIYDTGSWISTGASKGGMTATYHRRFYPNDVDATVAQAAHHRRGDHCGHQHGTESLAGPARLWEGDCASALHGDGPG